MKDISFIFACFAFSVMLNVNAADAAGDASVGKSKTATCVGCHGQDGNSTEQIYPRLAGGHESYLRKQLTDFKNHSRKNPMMEAMVAPLTEKDIANISAFYAGQKATFAGDGEEQYIDEDEEFPVTEELISAGKILYMRGNHETGVAACTACHGPKAAGNEAAGFPSIAGQYAAYVVNSLHTFKNGTRTNDAASMMQVIAKKMTSQEINAIASYISSLR